jgi:hypothetical protein
MKPRDKFFLYAHLNMTYTALYIYVLDIYGIGIASYIVHNTQEC